MRLKTRLHVLRLGLMTVLGLGRRGFFIPYRYAPTVPPPGRRPAYGWLEEFFAGQAANVRAHLAAMEELAGDLGAIGAAAKAPEPRWNQTWFPRLDAAAAYAMVRTRRPARLVEIGSGHSTRFYARAVRDGGLDTRITAIDPMPRADISALGVDTLRMVVQQAGAAPFHDLAPGDVLSIDSSHILMPGTDVDFLQNVILPTLPAGVLVHIHDTFLPDDYPAGWGWRGYNEQQGVAALLQGGGYDLLWSSRYAVTRLAGDLAAGPIAALPHFEAAPESSLWLEKR
ncbi:MAG: class I SAM-dependent methyltransferase [Hyphomicrobiales bacterium]|nr:class I SAM-dependent methyltransferase [Hyphomicrobiales bacterium]MCP5373286.1 class I SAM-dependent methyltransferase [Hyphomicrobiales bacterium]